MGSCTSSPVSNQSSFDIDPDYSTLVPMNGIYTSTPLRTYHDDTDVSSVPPPEMSSLSHDTSTINIMHTPIGENVTIRDDTRLSVDAHKTVFGYKLVGDNIDMEVTPRYARSDSHNKSLHYFHSYAVKSRIDVSTLSDVPTSSLQPPLNLVFQKLLPSIQDNEIIHANFRVHLQHILVDNLKFFNITCNDLVTRHITHKYYPEMSMKSNVVSALI